jgi:hypothetical protein
MGKKGGGKEGGGGKGKGLEGGRDRGSSGQKRRDIRVYLGGEGWEGRLEVGETIKLTDDQNHYLRERTFPYPKSPRPPKLCAQDPL